MKTKKNIDSLTIILVFIALLELFSNQPALGETETIALCEANKNTIRIYRENQELKMLATNRQDQIDWLNTAAQLESSDNGTTYTNIRGEQIVSLFIPSTSDSCSIAIGNQPLDLGTLMTEKMNTGIVTGTVTYRERIALPRGSQIQVKLLDVSRQDVAATEINSQTITIDKQQVPIPFELTYDESEIKESNTYVVRAEIQIEEQLAFTTTSMYPVITRGNSTEANLILQKVDSKSLSEQIRSSKWLLEDLNGRGVMDYVQTTLVFNSEESLGGSGGCNSYFAGYELNQTVLNVTEIGSTRKMCPEAVMNQENKYFEALEKAQSIRIEGPYLLIDSEGYQQPMRFTRLSE